MSLSIKYEKNKIHIHNWRETHIEVYNEYCKQYYDNNKNEIGEKKHAYRLANLDKCREYSKKAFQKSYQMKKEMTRFRNILLDY